MTRRGHNDSKQSATNARTTVFPYVRLPSTCAQKVEHHADEEPSTFIDFRTMTRFQISASYQSEPSDLCHNEKHCTFIHYLDLFLDFAVLVGEFELGRYSVASFLLTFSSLIIMRFSFRRHTVTFKTMGLDIYQKTFTLMLRSHRQWKFSQACRLKRWRRL
jgi:hypothetical protein